MFPSPCFKVTLSRFDASPVVCMLRTSRPFVIRVVHVCGWVMCARVRGFFRWSSVRSFFLSLFFFLSLSLYLFGRVRRRWLSFCPLLCRLVFLPPPCVWFLCGVFLSVFSSSMFLIGIAGRHGRICLFGSFRLFLFPFVLFVPLLLLFLSFLSHFLSLSLSPSLSQCLWIMYGVCFCCHYPFFPSVVAYETSGLVSFLKPENGKQRAPNRAHETPPFFGPLTPPMQPKTHNTLYFKGPLSKIVV